MGIQLKNPAEIARMQETGRIVAGILDAIERACVPGTTTADLNDIAVTGLARAKARSAFLGYRPGGLPPYPAVLCASVNEVVVHGIPSRKTILREGDIIGIDFACFKDGYCADSARTIPVGKVSEAARLLIETARESLELAIHECIPGRTLGDIGAAVQGHVEPRGFSVVREFVGHGIGRAMHEAPQVPSYGSPGRGRRLEAGMVIAIEPMVNAGKSDVRILDDQWTVVTADGGLSAHVEHSVAITADGPVVLTRP